MVIKLLKEPKIYLVTHTAVDWQAVREMLADQGLPELSASIRAADFRADPDEEDSLADSDTDSLATIEIAARLCYYSFGRGRSSIADFINNLLSSGDGSVFEHVNYGFCVTGISRSLSHEFVRHRPGWAYSQLSQRYVDESDAAFVIPPAMLDTDLTEFESVLGDAVGAYGRLTDFLATKLRETNKDLLPTDARKAVRSAARSVLPNATETKMFITGNVRSWRHFVEMRAHPRADLEIRRLAIAFLRVLQAREPLLFGDFEISTHTDGTEIATPDYWKI